MYGAAYAAVPGIKLVPITRSLHFIMLDQPAQFDAAVDGFLGKGINADGGSGRASSSHLR